MPTVPQYEIGQVQSRGINARQNIRVNQDTFGAGIAQQQIRSAQSTSRTADQLFSTALHGREQYEKGVLRELDNNFSTHIRTTLNDPENGFLMKNGRLALDNKDSTIKSLADYRKELGKDLNPRLKSAWDGMADARTNRALGRIDSHTMAQTDAYNKAQRDARIDNQVAEMATNMYDDKAINAAKQVGLIEIDDKLKDLGIDVNNPKDDDQKVMIKQARLAFTSKGHTEVIENLLAAEQDTRALEYYKTNKEEIDPSTYDALENKLNQQTQLKRAQRETDVIMSNPDLSYADQLVAARSIEDPKLRAKTVELVKVRQAEIETNNKRSEDEAYDQVQKHFLTPGATKADLPAGVWDAMSGTQQRTMQKALNERIANSLKPKNPITAKKIYYGLEDMAHSDYETFKKQNLSLYVGIVAESDLDKLRKLQKDHVAVKSSMTKAQQNKAVLGSMGFDFKDFEKNNDNGKRIRSFLDTVDAKVAAFMSAHNREPDDSEYQTILFNIRANEAYVNGWSVDSTYSLAILNDDEKQDAYVVVNGQDVYLSEIPDIDRAAIIERLKSRGEKVSAQRIAEIYVATNEYTTERTRLEGARSAHKNDGSIVSQGGYDYAVIKNKDGSVEYLGLDENAPEYKLEELTNQDVRSQIEQLKADLAKETDEDKKQLIVDQIIELEDSL